MPIPSINWPRSYVMGQFIAGRLESPILPVPTSIITTTFMTASTTGQGAQLQLPSGWGVGAYGGRTNFTATRDLSTHKYFAFQMEQFGWPFPNMAGFIDTLSNGGISIVIFDAVGSWSEFNLYGSEFTNMNLDSGGWGSFRLIGNTGSYQGIIDRGFSPDNSSGVLDWSQIDGYEFILRIANAGGGTPTVGLGSVMLFDEPQLLNGEVADASNYSDISAFIRADDSNYQMRDVYKDTGGNFSGGIGEIYEPRYSWSIGDGSTETYFRDTGSTTTPYLIRDSVFDESRFMPSLLVGGSERVLTINQSATDDVEFNGTILAASDSVVGNQDSIIVTGSSSGRCVFNAAPMYNKTLLDLAHSECINISFFNCERIRIGLLTTLSDCSVGLSSATSDGIYIDDVGGTYTQSVNFRASNLGNDITINPALNGTYDFPNISIEAGHTLALRNDSPTFDIDVGIPVGIPFTTSTAGGAINVTTPPIVITLSAPNLIDDTNVLLINNTQATELDASTVTGGTGYSINLTLGIEYALSDELILLAGYQQGGTAKEIFRFSALAGTENIQNIDFQRDWENPNVLGVDGSNIPECSTDYIEIQVEVDDADNSTEKSRIAAFIVDALQTFDGLRNWVSTDGIPVIDYPSSTSAVVDTDIALVEIINVKPNSTLEIKDSFEFYWKDGIDRVSALTGQDSNYEWVAPARVLLQETGTSGLTPAESAKLMATAEQSTLLDTQGAGFDTNNDSLVEIRANQGGGGGDATEANQLQILANQAVFMPEITNIDANTQQLLIDVDAVPTAIENADALLGRSNEGGKDGDLTVSESLMTVGRNKWDLDVNTGLMNIYRDDETTIAFSIQTTGAPRDPINSGDPV